MMVKQAGSTILKMLLVYGAVVSAATGYAQDLEVISLKKGVEVNGSVNLNTVAYAAVGMPRRRDPFNWFLAGGLNINLFGYSAPLSFSYSNAQTGYSQPFNQFSFAPQYKWVKTYIGYNSMTFSPYTLAGHVFFGGGVELTPAEWRIAIMYGRLRKAVSYNIEDTLQHTKVAYKRMGYGVKAAYEDNGDAINVSVFAAKDDPSSLPFVLPEQTVTPQQNVAISLGGRKKLFTKFFVDVEYAVSVLNTNRLANTISTDSVKRTKNLLKGLLPENSTSRYFDAINAGIGYHGSKYTVQLKYERIAPEYQTLGAYYFNNDMRNITVVTNVRLLSNKITLATNVGVQQNNLDHSLASSTNRTVGAVTIQYVPNEKWNLAGNYSNFMTYTNVRAQADPFFQNNLDTLDFYQLSQTMAGTVSRTLGTKERPQHITFNGSYQKASNKTGNEAGSQLSDFLNASVSYSYALTPSNLTLAVAINVFSNNAAGVNSSFFGPGINTTKSFFNKLLRASYSTSYSHTSSNRTATSPVWNNQANLSFAPKQKEGRSGGKSNFSLSISILRRLKHVGEQPAFTEFNNTLNYSYTF